MLYAQSGLGGRGREPVCDPAGLLRGVPHFRRSELRPHPEASVPVAALVAYGNDDAFAGAGERRVVSYHPARCCSSRKFVLRVRLS